MAELFGKGWRVLGILVWMIGAGIVLDSSAPRAGTFLLVCGAAMFFLGAWQSAQGRPNPENRPS